MSVGFRSIAKDMVSRDPSLAGVPFHHLLARGNTLFGQQDPKAVSYLAVGILNFENCDCAPSPEICSGVAMACVQLGDCFRETRQDDMALDAYRAATSHDSAFATGWYYCAVVSMEGGQYDEAITYLHQIVDRGLPENEEVTHGLVWFQIGYCHDELQRFPQAAAAYEQAYRHDATDFDTCYNLGRIYMQSGQPRRCIELYRYVLSWPAGVDERHRQIMSQRIQQCALTLRQPSSRPETSAQDLLARIRVLQGEGNHDEALRLCNEAIRQVEHNEDLMQVHHLWGQVILSSTTGPAGGGCLPEGSLSEATVHLSTAASIYQNLPPGQRTRWAELGADIDRLLERIAGIRTSRALAAREVAQPPVTLDEGYSRYSQDLERGDREQGGHLLRDAARALDPTTLLKKCRDCRHLESGLLSTRCKKLGRSVSSMDRGACHDYEPASRGFLDTGRRCRDCVFFEDGFLSGPQCKKKVSILGVGPDSNACNDYMDRRTRPALFMSGKTCGDCVYFKKASFVGWECLKGKIIKGPKNITCGEFRKK